MLPRNTEHPRPARRTGRRWPCWPAAVGLAAVLTAIPAVPAAAGTAFAATPASTPGNSVVAWGSNENGELGNGTTTNSSEPVFAQVPARFRYTAVRSVATSVALTTTGRVYGWGYNNFGQVGDGTDMRRLKPVRAKVLDGVKVTAVREGVFFGLALTSAGKVLTWGNNDGGELGDGTTRSRMTPVRVKIPRGVTVAAISAGFGSGMALTKSGRVLAWGLNDAGQLGDGTTKNRHVPVHVKLPGHTKITSIAAGHGTGYAVTSTGRLLAWGLNDAGQLGDSTTKNRLKPVQVRLPRGVKVASATAGYLYALALTTSGHALAWGYNAYGQLGDGSVTTRHVPVRVKLPIGTTRIRALAAGGDFGMALTAAGHILTWGHDNRGQLGNASATDSATPVPVHLPPGFSPTAIGAGFDAQTGLAIGHEVI
jgi:alpha-tubulin suppressor-like RCC1 family protein